MAEDGVNYEPSDEAAKMFFQAVVEWLKAVFLLAAADAVEETPGGVIDWDYLDEKAAEYATTRGAELVGMRVMPDGTLVPNPNPEWAISETTRDKVNDLLQRAMAEGWSPQTFADRLEETGVFNEARAEMIARTEVAIAQNRGQLATYKKEGFTHVLVYDGDYDPECQEADGQTWSIEDAEANPLEHPNCVRAFSPAPMEA